MKNGTLVLLFAGIALLAGFLVTDGFGAPTPGAVRESAAPGRQDGELALLRSQLDELAAGLARVERGRVSSPARRERVAPEGGPEEAALRGELAAVTAALQELQREVAALRPVAGAAPTTVAAAAELRELHGARPETNWIACDLFVQEWHAGREAAESSLHFLTPAQLLERLGAPTRVRGEEEGEVRWVYGTGEDAPRDYRIDLSLHDGYVTAVRVHAP